MNIQFIDLKKNACVRGLIEDTHTQRRKNDQIKNLNRKVIIVMLMCSYQVVCVCVWSRDDHPRDVVASLLGTTRSIHRARLTLVVVVLAALHVSQRLLPLDQLSHKVQIGRYDRALVLDKLVGLVHGELLVPHDISDGDGGRPRDARLAMHQHSAVVLANLV